MRVLMGIESIELPFNREIVNRIAPLITDKTEFLIRGDKSNLAFWSS